MSEKDFQENGKYSNSSVFPNRPIRPLLNISIANSINIRKYAHLMEQYENEMIEYKKKFNLHNEAEFRKIEEFKKDLFDELNITNNSKNEMLYYKSIDKTRAQDLYDVYLNALELVDLIK